LTKTLIFENYIGLGYEDGLVLVYIIERQNKTNQNIEEENNENDDNDKNNNEIKKNYYNAFSLYYIFLGHPQKITSLAYYDPKKYFITASDACLVKIFSITTGYSLFHFNLDCIINNILIIENKTNTNLIFLCEEPYKLNIDITNEPFSFNHYTFRYNNINNIVKVDKKYYLLGTSNNIYVFKENFDFDNKFSTEDKIDFDYFINYGKNFIVVDGEYNLRFCELKNNDIIFSFKFKLSNDNITTGMIIYNKFFLCGAQDGNVYLVNIDENVNRAWELEKMNNEEKESNIFNEEYMVGKNKKKKKDKDGGKDKDKKKKGKKK
jgi:WD40 repeat protein